MNPRLIAAAPTEKARTSGLRQTKPKPTRMSVATEDASRLITNSTPVRRAFSHPKKTRRRRSGQHRHERPGRPLDLGGCAVGLLSEGGIHASPPSAPKVLVRLAHQTVGSHEIQWGSRTGSISDAGGGGHALSLPSACPVETLGVILLTRKMTSPRGVGRETRPKGKSVRFPCPARVPDNRGAIRRHQPTTHRSQMTTNSGNGSDTR